MGMLLHTRMVTRAAISLGLVMITFAVGGLALAGPGTADTPATVLAADITLGVDVGTAGNDASTLGTIESCKRVNVGASFDVDLYITDVTGLMHWEYYFDYDGSLITPISETFMMVTGPSLSDTISSSKHFYGVGTTNAGSAASGSGVLARLTFHADALGVSLVAISHDPAWPIVEGTSPIEPTSNGHFDGPLIPAQIAIGQECPAGPIITPTPGPTVTVAPTDAPSPTPAPPMRGDSDCNGQIQLPDVIATLSGASQVGSSGNCSIRGDANCSGGLDANDALRELRFISDDPIAPPDGCQPVGDPIPS